MDLQHDVNSLKISKSNNKATFVKRTQKDALHLTAAITEKIGETPDDLYQQHPYDVTFWYLADVPENMPNVPPSDSLEEAFGEVHVWHERHKKVWDVTITEDKFLAEVYLNEDNEDFEDNNNDEQPLD